MLADLTDAVAEVLQQPFAALSLEMVFRSLHFYVNAHARGEADDLISYLAADAKGLSILKRKRKTTKPTPLDMMKTALDTMPESLTYD